VTALSQRVDPAPRAQGAPRRSRAERVAERAGRSFMPEIQVLRAVAVMVVVLYHFWPGTVTGGYVGVDAFFVISGYLITSHLLREVDRTGTVRLWAFYARRARRLLPASLFVLLFVAVGTFLLLPTDLWASTAHELAASGFYVQNLWLASKAVTYSASNDVASPVTHYWSLSAEEQFYLVWPALIIISCLAARRWLHGRTTTTVGFTLLAVTAGSFVFSVWATQAHGAAAYFITPTRAWEFGTGALVVLLMRRWVPPLGVAVLLRWGGWPGCWPPPGSSPACHGTSAGARVDQKCYWGTGRPSRVVALVGDSHVQGWRAPLHRIAKARNWQLIEIFAGGCPANSARSLFEHRTDADECRKWTASATVELKGLHPDDIITTAYVQQNVFEPVNSGPPASSRFGGSGSGSAGSRCCGTSPRRQTATAPVPGGQRRQTASLLQLALDGSRRRRHDARGPKHAGCRQPGRPQRLLL
jgi:hypothetical protein